MEEDIQSSGSMIPLALASLAIILGGAGIYLGLTANQQLAPIQESVEAGTSGLAEINKLSEGYQGRINELNTKIKNLESSLGRMRSYGNERDKAIKAIATALDANNTQTQKLSDQLAEVAAVTVRAPLPVVATEVEGAEDAASTVDAAAAGTYMIQSGDTFAKIASKKAVALDALLDANPGVNPKALQIGQVINLPVN